MHTRLEWEIKDERRHITVTVEEHVHPDQLKNVQKAKECSVF